VQQQSRQRVNSSSAAEPGRAAIENMALAWRKSPEGIQGNEQCCSEQHLPSEPAKQSQGAGF